MSPIKGSRELKKGQDWKQEIVAELGAAVLCKVVGKTSKHLGNSYRYIEQYAQSANLTPWQGCMRVMRDTEKMLNLIVSRNFRNELEKFKRVEGQRQSCYPLLLVVRPDKPLISPSIFPGKL